MGRGRRYLVTGGAGFIGSNFIRHLARVEPAAEVLNLDLLTYAGVRQTVVELEELGNHRLVQGDIRDAALVDSLVGDVDVVVHFAAESHVDRSIIDPLGFLSTNVIGTGVLLEAARRHSTARFIHISTDEVYGPIEYGVAADEDHPLHPSSPYAASKAAADLVIAASGVSHGYDPIITRCTNNYGPYQYPEKLVPVAITRIIDGLRVPVYGDGTQQRDWLWVGDHCAAIYLLVDEGEPGEVFNIGAGNPITNLELVDTVLTACGANTESIELVEDRPGHDARYALDSTKIRDLGWQPETDLAQGMAATVDWYRDRQDWWRPLMSR